MNRRFVLPILVSVLVAGCASAQDVTAPVAGRSSSELAPGTALMNGTIGLGWFAAAGFPSGRGDFVVGLRSEEYCPRASFVVPDGAAALRIDVSRGAGVGPYEVVIENPKAIRFEWRPTGEAYTFDQERPPAGPWSITMTPSIATALQKWTVDVGFEQPAPAPTELILTKDGQCI